MQSLKLLASEKVTEIFDHRHTFAVEGVFDGESCTYEAALALIKHRRFPHEVIRKNGRNGIAERPRLVNFLAKKAHEAGLYQTRENVREVALRALSYVEFKSAPGVLVSTNELAELLCVGKSTLGGWMQERGMPAPVAVRSLMRYWDSGEVVDWLRKSFGQEVAMPLLSKAQVISVVSKVSNLPIDRLISDYGMPAPLEFDGATFKRRWNYRTFADWLESVKFD